MGWFGSSSSDDDRRKEEVRTGARAPDRTERKRCWEARDNYFRCLDKHSVIDAVEGEGKKLSNKHCSSEDALFHQDCATAWVTYFKKFRVAEYQKKQTLERLESENATKVDMQRAYDFTKSADSKTQ